MHLLGVLLPFLLLSSQLSEEGVIVLFYRPGPYAGRERGRMTIDGALIRKTLQSQEWGPSGPSFHPASSFQPRPHGFLKVQRKHILRIGSPGAPGARTDQRTNA